MSNTKHLGLIFGFVVWMTNLPGAEAQVTKNSRAAGLTQCVEPTEFMRKNHMEVLFHQRDETVHKGVRTLEHSLVDCIECHVGRTSDGFIPVNAEGQFCQACHVSNAVEMDCFQCHATRPE